jgi:predicted transcriptional regulator
MRINLTDREAEFMEVLWEQGPSTVAEVREQLHDEPAYTTVLSILRNLESKGYVGPSKDGRAHRYAPLITREAAQSSALRSLAARLFKGSHSLLLTHLVNDHELSAEEIKRIRQLLSQQQRKGK